MLVFAAKLPFHAVDNTLDAGLKNIGGNPHRAPPFIAIGEDRQHSDQCAGTVLLIFFLSDIVHESDIELLQTNLGKLRIMFLENLPYGAVNGMDRAAAARGD